MVAAMSVHGRCCSVQLFVCLFVVVLHGDGGEGGGGGRSFFFFSCPPPPAPVSMNSICSHILQQKENKSSLQTKKCRTIERGVNW